MKLQVNSDQPANTTPIKIQLTCATKTVGKLMANTKPAIDFGDQSLLAEHKIKRATLRTRKQLAKLKRDFEIITPKQNNSRQRN